MKDYMLEKKGGPLGTDRRRGFLLFIIYLHKQIEWSGRWADQRQTAVLGMVIYNYFIFKYCSDYYFIKFL